GDGAGAVLCDGLGGEVRAAGFALPGPSGGEGAAGRSGRMIFRSPAPRGNFFSTDCRASRIAQQTGSSSGCLFSPLSPICEGAVMSEKDASSTPKAQSTVRLALWLT